MKLRTDEVVTYRLVIGGRIDALAAPELRTQMSDLLTGGTSQLVVDLADVTFIDSAGLAALVRAMKQARETGGDVELVRPRLAEAFRVFELTKLDSVFTIHEPRD